MLFERMPSWKEAVSGDYIQVTGSNEKHPNTTTTIVGEVRSVSSMSIIVSTAVGDVGIFPNTIRDFTISRGVRTARDHFDVLPIGAVFTTPANTDGAYMVKVAPTSHTFVNTVCKTVRPYTPYESWDEKRWDFIRTLSRAELARFYGEE